MVHQNKNKSSPSWCFFSSPCSPTLTKCPRDGTALATGQGGSRDPSPPAAVGAGCQALVLALNTAVMGSAPLFSPQHGQPALQFGFRHQIRDEGKHFKSNAHPHAVRIHQLGQALGIFKTSFYFCQTESSQSRWQADPAPWGAPGGTGAIQPGQARCSGLPAAPSAGTWRQASQGKLGRSTGAGGQDPRPPPAPGSHALPAVGDDHLLLRLPVLGALSLQEEESRN